MLQITRRETLLPWMFVFCMTFMQVWSFNLEPESAQVFSDPNFGKGRESYFGYSVALHYNSIDDTNWLLVGAPRSNSSERFAENIREPGAVFKCNLQRDEIPCHEIKLGGNLPPPVNTVKEYGWIGGAMDSQPIHKEGRHVTAVCAPRWKNRYRNNPSIVFMNGECYWLNTSLSDDPAHKLNLLSSDDKQTYPLYNRHIYYHYYGQAGMSVHFPDNNKEMIIGAPGILNWQGSVTYVTDEDFSLWSSRQVGSQPQRSEAEMFTSVLTPNPISTRNIKDFELNGYAVTSGNFYSKGQTLYVSGAPRGDSMYGKVMVFAFPEEENNEMLVVGEWKGTQLGENFGASLASADLNKDGLSDLVVGSPTYSDGKNLNMGRIQIFLSQPRIGELRKVSSHSGMEKPYAKFGTTLASLGDLNLDGFHDIAVGAPWEDDGDGAVYIYLGSPFGLRKSFSQRLTPNDFPHSRPLKGFGMSISRGIDIDRNGYPDLAVGSFTSGHALVLKSRTTAVLRGSMKSEPSALALNTSTFQLNACVFYSGHLVPLSANIAGRIMLDNGYPAPRISFSDIQRPNRNFNVGIRKDQTNCQPFDVQVKTLTTDVRRPILVNFEYKIEDIPGQRMSQPITDYDSPSNFTLPIRILTDCEEDGDFICKTDMHVKASFKNYREDDSLVIGNDTRPQLEINVTNSRESVFLPKVIIEVQKPFGLFKPNSHKCDYSEEGRTNMVCELKNPITKDDEDTVIVNIDASHVTDATTELNVNVSVQGEGVEQFGNDNSLIQKMKLVAEAEMKLTGYSRQEQVTYPRVDENTVNTTNLITNFTHHFTLHKTGPTPVEKIEFTVDIPVNVTGGPQFVKLYSLKTNFMNQPFHCTVEGAAVQVESSENGGSDGTDVAIFGNEPEVPQPTKGDGSVNFLPGPKETTGSEPKSSVHKLRSITCQNENVSCAEIRCSINMWPGGIQHSAQFSILMAIDFEVLAKYISVRDGATFISTSKTWSLTNSQDKVFEKKMKKEATVETYLIPLSPPGEGLPWWYILIAVLVGLLLLILLAVLLHKLGFFRRKEQEKMKAQKAEVMSQTNYGATVN